MDAEPNAKFGAMGLIPICTEAAYFSPILKKHLLDGEMFDAKRSERVLPMLEKVMAEASRLRRDAVFA